MAKIKLDNKFNDYYYDSDEDIVFSTKGKTVRALTWCKNSINSTEYVNVVDSSGNKTRLSRSVIHDMIAKSTTPCIMKIGDYISRKTIQQLTKDQYNEFRSYLRSHGYQVQTDYGTYENLSQKSNLFVRLDREGDLFWNASGGSGKEILKYQIMEVIESNKTSLAQKYFIMAIEDGFPIMNYAVKVYLTEDMARDAAEKLAKENPTKKFCVLKCCGVVQSRGVEWD